MTRKLIIDNEYIKNEYLKGRSAQKIANELKISQQTIQRRLKELNIKSRPAGNIIGYNPSEKARKSVSDGLKRAYAEGTRITWNKELTKFDHPSIMSISVKTKENASNGRNNGYKKGHEFLGDLSKPNFFQKGNKRTKEQEEKRVKGILRVYADGTRKPVEGIGKWNIGYKRSDKTRKKHSATQQGISIDDWKGYISFEPYCPKFNKEFKYLVKLRDNFCCKNCGISEQKNIIICNKGLAIHHMDYNKKNTCLQNCVSLCTSCHGKTTNNRNYWQDYFKEMLSRVYNYRYELNNEEIKNGQ